jgi:phage baseplate assembly protein W
MKNKKREMVHVEITEDIKESLEQILNDKQGSSIAKLNMSDIVRHALTTYIEMNISKKKRA